jgi:hypothetical protein
MCQNDTIFPRAVPEPLVHWHRLFPVTEGIKPLKENAVILPMSQLVHLFRLNSKRTWSLLKGSLEEQE